MKTKKKTFIGIACRIWDKDNWYKTEYANMTEFGAEVELIDGRLCLTKESTNEFLFDEQYFQKTSVIED